MAILPTVLRFSAVIFLMLASLTIQAQVDSFWNVALHHQNKEPDLNDKLFNFNETGFYLYRNCVYNFELTDGSLFNGRLIDVKPDSVCLTNFFNRSAAERAGMKHDSAWVHYGQLAQLKLIADRSMGIYTKHNLTNYTFVFEQDTQALIIPSYIQGIYTNDSTLFEIVPTLTAQGIDWFYELDGQTYYYRGGVITRADPALMDTTYNVRKGIWFTPCKVEEINGLALGVFTENIKHNNYREDDSLVVNGVNLEIFPFAIFTIPYMHLAGPYADSFEFYEEHLVNDISTKVNGFNFGLVNTVNEERIKGFSISGFITLVDEIHGVSISGWSNFAYVFNGVSIAAIHNRSTRGRGFQLGLVNKSVDFRGLQIGVWNTNGKRSLPILNWQFKP